MNRLGKDLWHDIVSCRVDVDTALEMYRKGSSLGEIGFHFGVSRELVHYHLKRNRLYKGRSAKQAHPPKYVPTVLCLHCQKPIPRARPNAHHKRKFCSKAHHSAYQLKYTMSWYPQALAFYLKGQSVKNSFNSAGVCYNRKTVYAFFMLFAKEGRLSHRQTKQRLSALKSHNSDTPAVLSSHESYLNSDRLEH